MYSIFRNRCFICLLVFVKVILLDPLYWWFIACLCVGNPSWSFILMQFHPWCHQYNSWGKAIVMMEKILFAYFKSQFYNPLLWWTSCNKGSSFIAEDYCKLSGDFLSTWFAALGNLTAMPTSSSMVQLHGKVSLYNTLLSLVWSVENNTCSYTCARIPLTFVS